MKGPAGGRILEGLDGRYLVREVVPFRTLGSVVKYGVLSSPRFDPSLLALNEGSPQETSPHGNDTSSTERPS